MLHRTRTFYKFVEEVRRRHAPCDLPALVEDPPSDDDICLAFVMRVGSGQVGQGGQEEWSWWWTLGDVIYA